MTRRILAATDFSDVAEAALRIAIQTARTLHAELHVLHVFTPGETAVTQLLADAAASAGPDVQVKVSATGGHPAQEILRYAARQSVDLIVLGAHGRSGVSRILLGGVAERVLREARCPVLVVPPGSVPGSTAGSDTARPPAEVETLPIRRCLVCGGSTADLICETCRARIRGEALEQKQREERAGRA